MGNVLKLIQSWFSSQSDDARNTPTASFHLSSFIATDRPVYSWDNKSEIESNQFRLDRLNEQHIFQNLAHQGQQFTIENCFRSLILITGFSDSIFIDDCKDCKIILGPVKGSIFLRNCSKCVVVAACGQLRTRDCTDVTCYLFCASQPSIESSFLMKFQCISLDYPGLHGHFTNAGLNPSAINRWSEVFDFTPTSLSSNWTFLNIEDRLEDNLNEIELIHCTDHQIAFDRTRSAIPFTHPALKTSAFDNSVLSVGRDISENFDNLLDCHL